MSRLNDYIEKTKKYIEEHKDLTETEIVRYVYLDLGKRFSFDLNFVFGNSKTKKQIYKNSGKLENLNKSMENNVVICKLSSYLQYNKVKRWGEI